jgi:uncharacterized DUF497 family protein
LKTSDKGGTGVAGVPRHLPPPGPMSGNPGDRGELLVWHQSSRSELNRPRPEGETANSRGIGQRSWAGPEIRSTKKEERWFSIGYATNGSILVVIYLWSGAGTAVTKIRLISARKCVRPKAGADAQAASRYAQEYVLEVLFTGRSQAVGGAARRRKPVPDRPLKSLRVALRSGREVCSAGIRPKRRPVASATRIVKTRTRQSMPTRGTFLADAGKVGGIHTEQGANPHRTRQRTHRCPGQ